MNTLSEVEHESRGGSLERAILRWPTKRSKEWTLDLLVRAPGDKNITAIVAVGSTTRPGVPSTDLDLIAICEDRLAFKRRNRATLEIDIRIYRSSDVEDSIERGHDMLGWAVTFGKVLFQRDGYWDGVVRRWRDRLPFPDIDSAYARASDSYRWLSEFHGVGDTDAAYEHALSYLTHLARAALVEREVYPASRPELPGQLREAFADAPPVAEWLERLLDGQPTRQEMDDLIGSRLHEQRLLTAPALG
jgi:hypothetical protein